MLGMRAIWIVPVIASILILGTLIPFIPYQNAFAVTTVIDTDTTGDQTVNADDMLTITNGATLTGDVTVDGGILTVTDSSKVDGDIKAKNGGSVTITGSSTVNGDVEANCQSVTITGSTINGNVKAENCDSVNIKDSEIFGDLEIENVNEVDIENGSFTNIELQANNSISVSGTFTDDDIEIEQANSLTFSANIIEGDLKIKDVADCTVSGNIIIGDTDIDPNCLLTPIIAGHLVFDSFSATNDNANTSTVVSVMSASFEAAEGDGLFGIVAFGEQNKHLAVTSHFGVANSEIPDGGADGTTHTHVLIVKVTEDCADFIITNPAEFDGLAIKSVSFKEIGTITDFEVSGGDTLDISDIFAEGVGGQLSGDGASFELVLVGDDICIDIKDTFP